MSNDFHNFLTGVPLVESPFFDAILTGDRPQLPEDRRDPRQYPAANPDVAAAGADARQHHVEFGIRENRKLRP